VGKKRGAALEKEEALTCGPHTSAGEREREGSGGPSGKRAAEDFVGCGGGEEGGKDGPRVGFAFFLFVFFKSILNNFSNTF
jgi:hypothetical protein